MQILSPGDIVFLFMKFQFHLNTFFFHLYEANFISNVIHTYAIFIGEYAVEYWGRGGGGGEYPQNALITLETFIECLKWLITLNL